MSTSLECRGRYLEGQSSPNPVPVDLFSLAGVVMLVLWAAGTFYFDAPGLIHGLLTLGIFMIVLGAVKRAERARKKSA